MQGVMNTSVMMDVDRRPKKAQWHQRWPLTVNIYIPWKLKILKNNFFVIFSKFKKTFFYFINLDCQRLTTTPLTFSWSTSTRLSFSTCWRTTSDVDCRRCRRPLLHFIGGKTTFWEQKQQTSQWRLLLMHFIFLFNFVIVCIHNTFFVSGDCHHVKNNNSIFKKPDWITQFLITFNKHFLEKS